MKSNIPYTHPSSIFFSRTIENTAYVTLVIGYLITIFTASHHTPLLVLIFTATQILYAAILRWITIHEGMSHIQIVLITCTLLALTLTSGLLSALTLYFDWLLYFVTVAIFFLLLRLRIALLTSLVLYVASGITLALINSWTTFLQTWATLLAGFAFVAAFTIGNKVLNQQRRQMELLIHQLEVSNQEREAANKQLQHYASEVEELTRDTERTRLAREIHDTLGHYLTILSIQLETISKLQEQDPARAALEVAEARRVTAQSMQEVRNAVAALRPSNVAIVGLLESLQQLGSEFQRTMPDTEITLDLDLDTQLPTLSTDVEHTLYRVAQEALTNVRKHAHATKVLLRLRYEENVIELVVLDNGTGKPGTQRQSSGFGLIGLRERVELLAGQVLYGAEQPHGYRVTVRIPVQLATIDTSQSAKNVTSMHDEQVKMQTTQGEHLP